MKKILTFILIFILIFSISAFCFASPGNVIVPDNSNNRENNSQSGSSPQSTVDVVAGNSDDINNTINQAGNTAMNVGQNILDQITTWCLPFCAIFVIWGAVQYFILGIRNLYKKRQGLLMMWGSITFYVVALFANLILTFMSGR